MPNNSPHGYTFGHEVIDEKSMSFVCSDDQSKWPWLTLHPSNQIPLQMMCYFASVETAAARGTLDETKWSALTKISWECAATAPEAAHARHGHIEAVGEAGAPDFAMIFKDASGNLVYRMDGKGVVFQNRDFEAWRAQAKEEARALPEPDGFTYAASDMIGVRGKGESLVSSLQETPDALFAEALITAENGFPPTHPYHDGSGDHVNSSHLADAIQQTAYMIRHKAGKSSICTAGSIVFKRYIELGRIFRIAVDPARSSDETIAFVLSQGANTCAVATFSFIEGL